MSEPAPRRFELTDDLPRGRLSIEASAGTGKTYALAGLAARYLLEEGVAIGELLLVTFTRAAAAELRDRVRALLVAAAAALRTVAEDPAAVASGDELVVRFCAADVGLRLERAQSALTDFDAASITTIHGFAQQVLGTLGVTAPGDPDAAVADDGGELLVQVATDVLVAAALDPGVEPDDLPGLDTLVRLAREVEGNPGIVLAPGPDPYESSEAAVRWRALVDAVVAGAQRRRRAAGALSFDEVLTRLRDALLDPVTGPASRDTLRRRYRVALIDEFQDTDPVQWQIFDALFGDPAGESTLILVGDPKQAIYSFRGANVHTYLEAIDAAGTERVTLAVNWRSDKAALDALETVLDGATFGDGRMGFQHVDAADKAVDRRLLDADGEPWPALSLRLALGANLDRYRDEIRVPSAERAIFADLAAEVQRLLTHARLPDGDGTRAVTPKDIAVLVLGHTDSPKVRDALRQAAIPAVIARGDSVLVSDAATQWRWLLEAVAQPADPGRARTACLSWFVGWGADELAAADDRAMAVRQETFHRWGEVLLTRGVTEFVRTVEAESGVAARVLAMADGDRAMTDLDHLAELLCATAARRAGPAGLLAALDQLAVTTRTAEPELDPTARRVESEEDAVAIMTVHAAKGLEFPIVCVPTMWRGTAARAKPSAIIYRDPAGHRTIDVAFPTKWPTKNDADARQRLADLETVGQNLRLLYVALTRAQHHTVLWWTRTPGSAATGVARVLFARDAAGIDPVRFVAPKVDLPADAEAAGVLAPLVAAAGGALEVAVIDAPTTTVAPWVRGTAPVDEPLAPAMLERTFDRTRRRWSFTAITRDTHAAHYDPLDASLGDAGAGDEPAPENDGDGPPGPITDTDRYATVDVPLGALRGGAAFGTLVHEVLEHVDFAAESLDGEVRRSVEDAVRFAGVTLDVDALTDGLVAAVRSPLGPIASGRALRDIPRADRLDELAFQFTLAEAGHRADDADLGRLLLRHLPAEDPYRPWAARVADGRFSTTLAGQLVGSIDVVLRVADPGLPPRFVVLDYKSNDLTRRGEAPSVADYLPDRLPEAMADADYPLQALLYSVALHRYLRWRLPDYDPAVHLGGVAYLFLRGMVGPHTPLVDGRPAGVASWHVPPALVSDLSDLLDGREVPT